MDSIKIGNQTWMLKNLDVDTFRNGDAIPEVKTEEEWIREGKKKQPAWCYYDNDSTNGEKHGKLYNWYAVNDPRGFAPTGWHIPTNEEWTILTNHLEGDEEAGKKMKFTNYWANNKDISGNGSNESGFSGLPSGARNNEGQFEDLFRFGNWWSSSEGGTYGPWMVGLGCPYDKARKGSEYKDAGISVRCIKD
jgi:uncharacterized protein (TIGR02145 family)